MPLSRVMADTLLFQMMPSCGGRNGEVNAIFRAVRVGGGAAWRRHRERQVDGGLVRAIVSNVKQGAKLRSKKESL